MGEGCGRRAPTGSSNPGPLVSEVPSTPPINQPAQAPRHFFLGREWLVALTPREKFREAIKRVIALAKWRKRTAYAFHLLGQLKEQAKNGRPSPQALFLELERTKGVLKRSEFREYCGELGTGYWRTIPKPEYFNENVRRSRTGRGEVLPEPYGRSPTRARSYGRVLVSSEGSGSIPRLQRDQEAPKSRAKPKPKGARQGQAQ